MSQVLSYLKKRAAALIASLALMPGLVLAPVYAADWPTRTVTIVVPFSAGGNTDTMARLAGEFLTKRLGQTFIVENRPAGGGIVAAAQIAAAPPDGSLLFFASAGQMIILPAMQQVKYDPEKDFSPVSIFGTGPFVLGVRNALPVKTLKELVEYGKKNPGKLNVASAGPGSIGHLSAALFARKAGIDLVFVPYKGGGPAMNGFLGGDVDMYFGNASELIQHKDSGRIRLLAVSVDQPLAQIPDVPPVASMFPGFKTSSWNGFLVRSGTPQTIIAKLEAEMALAVKDPAIRDRMEKLGIRPDGSTAKEFAATIEADRPLYREAIEAAGLKMPHAR